MELSHIQTAQALFVVYEKDSHSHPDNTGRFLKSLHLLVQVRKLSVS
jgi:hypothetical protein